MSSVQLPRIIVNQILSQAQHSPEQEICGLIAAKGGVPVHSYPVKNVAQEANHLFTMDPAGQIAAMRTMRENGEELFAIYHSHPHGPAKPSPADLREAAYPDALYLIVSLNTGGLLEMQGFRLRGEDAEPVELELS